MQIRGAVLYEQGKPRPYAATRPIHIETLTLDPPGPGEVLVKVEAAGLCHSDLTTIEGGRARKTPLLLGHEGAGVVVQVGAGVTGLAEGDHVVFVFVTSCGVCRQCTSGRPFLCASSGAARAKGELVTGARRLRIGGTPVNHNSGISCFADHAVVAEASVVRIDKDVPFEDAALFGCAVVTGVGAVLEGAGVVPGQSVAVVGLGGVGFSALLGAVLAGASRIVAVDLSPEKLALARQLGATDTVVASEADAAARILAMTDGGVDYAVETAGVVPALELAYAVTVRGGTTVTAGLPHAHLTFSVSPYQMVQDAKTVRGSYMGNAVARRDLARYVDLYRRGKLPIDRLRSATIGLDQINEGFDRLAEGKVVRQVMRF
jgi:alcohol dehydrogenase